MNSYRNNVTLALVLLMNDLQQVQIVNMQF